MDRDVGIGGRIPGAGWADGTSSVGEPARVRGLGWVLLGISLGLSLVSLAFPALFHHPVTRDRGELQLYLDVGEEGNLPTWWSSGLLVFAALVFGLVALLARMAASRGWWAWLVGAAVVAALSLDEHTSLHERLEPIGRQITTFDRFPFSWVVPGLGAAAVVAVSFLLLAWRLRAGARWCLLAGCAMLLGAALGGELLQGLQLGHGLTDSPLYALTIHAEELGENLGALLLLAAATRAITITRHHDHLTLRYTAGQPNRRPHRTAAGVDPNGAGRDRSAGPPSCR